MHSFRIFTIVIGLVAICFATAAPLFSMQSQEFHVLELLDVEEENQSENEENQEEHVDDDIRNSMYEYFTYVSGNFHTMFSFSKFQQETNFQNCVSPPPDQA